VATKKELVGSELMREVIYARIDTLWKMLALQKDGYFPKVDEEGATGEFDNKGAVFVPGGLVLEDSDRNSIVKQPYGRFKDAVRAAMRFDNATLLFQDGIASGVNLNNGFFADIASRILANKIAALKRKKLGEEAPARITSEEITRSYCPSSISTPYGSRTRLSSCISVCLTEPRMYFEQCRANFGLREDDEKKAWDEIRLSGKPVVRGENALALPHIVVCHDARYRESSLVGMTRILGIGKFGEFATFTLEEATTALLHEVDVTKTQPSSDEIVATYDGKNYVGVLRTYPATTLGKRSPRSQTLLVSPEKDLGLKVKKIEEEARERYHLS